MIHSLNINGQIRTVEVEGETPLLWVLRDVLELKGTKYGCGIGLCGACTVHIDGQTVRACSTPIAGVADRKVTTIEAIGDTPTGRKIQDAWLAVDVAQCGYCQAGQIMSATALLNTTAKPTDSEIDAHMGGNLCRCATYTRIRVAIKLAAGIGPAKVEG
jgi:isoquinoline 1-oxidoreductase alpha subunit